ncbi:MAG: MAPEG family protein [Stagnimonas sp.]|nr:MAPEG family protein [Stagnimonas sp.]
MAAYHALLGFTGWTLLMVLGVFAYRGFKFLSGTPINSWPRGVKSTTDAPIISRFADAHANCLENLVIFAVIVLAAGQLPGKLELIAPFAPYVLYARIGQSLAHLSGTGKINVLLRATFWSIQLGLFFFMLSKLFG